MSVLEQLLNRLHEALNPPTGPLDEHVREQAEVAEIIRQLLTAEREAGPGRQMGESESTPPAGA